MRLENPNFMVLTIPPDDLDARRVNYPNMSAEEYLTNYLAVNRLVPRKTDFMVIPPDSDLYDEAFETMRFLADANDTVFEVIDRGDALVKLTEEGEVSIKNVRLVWTNRVPVSEDGAYSVH